MTSAPGSPHPAGPAGRGPGAGGSGARGSGAGGPRAGGSGARRGAWTAGALLLLAALAVWAALAGAGPAVFDAAALDESLELRSTAWTSVAVVITTLGSTASMAVLAVLVTAWCWWRGHRADAALAVVAMGTASLVFTVLKRVFDRPRPPVADRLLSVTNESLPSGHATMSIVVIGTIVVLAWARLTAPDRGLLVVSAALWVGAVGATRVYLGVHWFSDVIAGWLVGAGWLAVCVALWSWWRARHPAESAVHG